MKYFALLLTCVFLTQCSPPPKEDKKYPYIPTENMEKAAELTVKLTEAYSDKSYSPLNIAQTVKEQVLDVYGVYP